MTWAIDGVEVRAVLIKNAAFLATEDSEEERADLWFMFLAIQGNDSWVAYGIVDTIEDEPKDTLAMMNITRLKKLSIVIGDKWEKIDKNIVGNAMRHQKLNHDAEVVNETIMEMSFTELQEQRARVDFEGIARFWGRQGMTLSLN